MKPICLKCNLFYRPVHNGFIIEEGMPDGGGGGKKIRHKGVNPGDNRYQIWSAYKLWRGDKWRCNGCRNEIVVGFAPNPIAEHYQSDYESARRECGGDSIPFIHDC